MEALVNFPHHYYTTSSSFTIYCITKFFSTSHLLSAFWLVSGDTSSSLACQYLQRLPFTRGCDQGRLKYYLQCLQQGTPMPFNFGLMNFPSGTSWHLTCINYIQFQALWKSRPESYNLGGRKFSGMLIFHCTLYLQCLVCSSFLFPFLLYLKLFPVYMNWGDAETSTGNKSCRGKAD